MIPEDVPAVDVGAEAGRSVASSGNDREPYLAIAVPVILSPTGDALGSAGAHVKAHLRALRFGLPTIQGAPLARHARIVIVPITVPLVDSAEDRTAALPDSAIQPRLEADASALSLQVPVLVSTPVSLPSGGGIVATNGIAAPSHALWPVAASLAVTVASHAAAAAILFPGGNMPCPDPLSAWNEAMADARRNAPYWRGTCDAEAPSPV